MTSIDKFSGVIKDTVATTLQKTKKVAPAVSNVNIKAGGTRKLTASLDAMATQNRALAAQNKAELLKLAKLRETLEKHGIKGDALDMKTLRRISARSEEIGKTAVDKLQTHGCAPTELPSITAAFEIIEHPYVSPDTLLAGRVKKALSDYGVYPSDYSEKTLSDLVKKAKKNTKQLSKAFKKALKTGAPVPTQDPVNMTASDFAATIKPKKAPQVGIFNTQGQMSPAKAANIADDIPVSLPKSEPGAANRVKDFIVNTSPSAPNVISEAIKNQTMPTVPTAPGIF